MLIMKLLARRRFLRRIQGNLVLETPNDVINTMFSFAKIRGSESIFDTKGGYMQSLAEKLIMLLFGQMIRLNISIHFFHI